MPATSRPIPLEEETLMEHTMAPGVSPAIPAAEEDRIYRKVGWRLVPLLVVCYVVALSLIHI